MKVMFGINSLFPPFTLSYFINWAMILFWEKMYPNFHVSILPNVVFSRLPCSQEWSCDTFLPTVVKEKHAEYFDMLKKMGKYIHLSHTLPIIQQMQILPPLNCTHLYFFPMHTRIYLMLCYLSDFRHNILD